jgi:hypothetical protein
MEAVQRLEALLAPVARVLDAAEGQLDAAAGAVVVDEHLAAVQLARHAQLAAAVAGPHAGHQAVGGAVGDRQGLGLAVERDHTCTGPKISSCARRCAGRHGATSVGGT